MTKLVPIAAAPTSLRHLREGGQALRLSPRVRYLLAISLTLLLIAVPFLIASPDYLIQSLKSPVLRSTWETVWALIDGYYSYGVAGGVDRFDPAMAGAAQHPTRLPWTLITIGFGFFYLFLYTRRVDWAGKRQTVAFAALTLNLLTLYFKGYSPQFLITLLPFVILLVPGWRGVAYALLLSFVNLVEYPVYFLLLPDQHWLLAGTVLLRTLILIILCFEYAAQVYDWRVNSPWWGRTAKAVVVLAGFLAVIGAVLGFRAYAQTQYEASPHQPAMEVIGEAALPGAIIVTDDLSAFEQLYPYLHSEYQLELVETHDYLPPWQPRLEALAARAQGKLWLYTQAGSPLHDWLAERYAPPATYQLGSVSGIDSWQLSAWDTQ
jgi:hypothetical protein